MIGRSKWPTIFSFMASIFTLKYIDYKGNRRILHLNTFRKQHIRENDFWYFDKRLEYENQELKDCFNFK